MVDLVLKGYQDHRADQGLKDYLDHRAQMAAQALKATQVLKVHLAHQDRLGKVVSATTHLSIHWQ